MTELVINNRGSLMTYTNKHGKEQCLGYLMSFEQYGIFDASLGKLGVTKDEAETHNKLLDEALLNGLDDNCEIGQGDAFYFCNDGKAQVTTFLGTVVATEITKRNMSLTFKRKGKVYRGRLQKDCDLFNFKRIA